MKTSFLLLLAAFCAALAVGSQDAQRVENGHAARIEDWPFMANIYIHDWNVVFIHFCDGVLITSSAVLSSASHQSGINFVRWWRVYLGSPQTNASGATRHDVSQIIIHEDYNESTKEADLAILRLATPAVYNDRVAPVGIAGPLYTIPDNAIVNALGWGPVFSGHAQLQELQLNVVNQELCAQRYAQLKTEPGFQGWPDVTPDMLCSADTIGCQGQSAGPIVHNRNVVVGVISWGYSCTDRSYPGVSVRVSQYVDWIVRHGST